MEYRNELLSSLKIITLENKSDKEEIKKQFKIWALKGGGHPDRGGDTKIFQEVSNIIDDLDKHKIFPKTLKATTHDANTYIYTDDITELLTKVMNNFNLYKTRTATTTFTNPNNVPIYTTTFTSSSFANKTTPSSSIPSTTKSATTTTSSSIPSTTKSTTTSSIPSTTKSTTTTTSSIPSTTKSATINKPTAKKSNIKETISQDDKLKEKILKCVKDNNDNIKKDCPLYAINLISGRRLTVYEKTFNALLEKGCIYNEKCCIIGKKDQVERVLNLFI
jgi:hypothetical protein